MGKSGSGGSSSSSPVVRLLAQWREFRQQHPDAPLSEFLTTGKAVSQLASLEIICVDLLKRLRAGAAVRVEDYLQQFPQIADAPEMLLELIDAELCVRSEASEQVTRQEYFDRFPALGEQLQKMFDFHQLESRLGQLPSPIAVSKPDIKDAPDGFRLLSEIRHDETGTIFRAIELQQQRKVAVKFLNVGSQCELDKRRWTNAIDSWKKLKHPCLLPIYSAGFDQLNRLFYAFELSEGMSLSEMLRQPLTGQNAIRYLSPIVSVMATANRQSITAINVDPRLIQINHQDQVRVLDLGLFDIVSARHENHADKNPIMANAVPQPARALNDSQRHVVLSSVLLLKMLLGDASWNPHADPFDTCEALRKRLLECEAIDPDLFNLIANSWLSDDRPAPAYVTIEEFADDLGRLQNGQRVHARRSKKNDGRLSWWWQR